MEEGTAIFLAALMTLAANYIFDHYRRKEEQARFRSHEAEVKHQFEIQRRDTKEQFDKQAANAGRLAQLTSNLQTQVNQLSVQLDQSLARLHRAQELVGMYHMATLHLYHVENLIQEAYKPEVKEAFVKAKMYSTELRALIKVIGDDELLKIMEESESGDPSVSTSNIKPPGVPGRDENVLTNKVERLHQRIYQLLKIEIEK